MIASEMRNYFKSTKITYDDITKKDIDHLAELLDYEIKRQAALGITHIEGYRLLDKKDVKFKKDGTLKYCYMYVGGNYFPERPCIMFDNTGELTIAFWADAYNISPIIDAFVDWCDDVKNGVYQDKKTEQTDNGYVTVGNKYDLVNEKGKIRDTVIVKKIRGNFFDGFSLKHVASYKYDVTYLKNLGIEAKEVTKEQEEELER